MEIFKDVPNYEGIYQISNFGNCISLRYNRKLVASTDKNGYNTFLFSVKKNKKTFKSHRLVAISFIDNPNNLPCVNHIDGNKQNNCINNLEWCTHKENTKHAFDTGLIKEKKSRKILDIKSKVLYNNYKEVCKIFNIKKSTLISKLNGTLKNNTNFKYA
jgi:hypothetical protein